jgi:hypothetical protein
MRVAADDVCALGDSPLTDVENPAHNGKCVAHNKNCNAGFNEIFKETEGVNLQRLLSSSFFNRILKFCNYAKKHPARFETSSLAG